MTRDPSIQSANAAPEPSLWLCAAADLEEKGLAVSFELRLFGQPARGFALRFDGQVVAYINRCAHIPTEMEWQPGEFLDAYKRVIICSLHGAEYSPKSGRCAGGPCAGRSLIPVPAFEEHGQVRWRATRDITPPTPLPSRAPSPSAKI